MRLFLAVGAARGFERGFKELMSAVSLEPVAWWNSCEINDRLYVTNQQRYSANYICCIYLKTVAMHITSHRSQTKFGFRWILILRLPSEAAHFSPTCHQVFVLSYSQYIFAYRAVQFDELSSITRTTKSSIDLESSLIDSL